MNNQPVVWKESLAPMELNSLWFKMNYINLDDKIPKTSEYFFDDCHFTDLGSITVADNILPVLITVIDNAVLKRDENIQ